MIEQIDALEKIKKLEDNSQDIIFADPPYALGSTVLIGKDGKPYYKEAKDFMNKWDMPDEKFWEEFFIEANRVLKFGGRVLFFGIDRQLMLFQYYGIASGLEIKQSLYWYFISNFPKATDLSKQIDKRLGVDRKLVGTRGLDSHNITNGNNCFRDDGLRNDFEKANELTASNTVLGKKYEGYKYSISPLKQVLETVMVFQKPNKNKSILDDAFAYEAGDLTISPSIWDIDSGRVEISKDDENLRPNAVGNQRKQKSDNLYGKGIGYNNILPDEGAHNTKSRFPSQLLIDQECADILDNQSGVNKESIIPNDAARCSKILHKVGHLDVELDLLIYSTKVSSKERNAGCEDFEDVDVGANNHANPISMKNTQINTSSGKQRNVTTVTKNNHPTLKPIKLIYKIAQLLKSPNPQNVFFPFAGTGSEIIGFMKAGFDENLFECSELLEDYVEIAKARIEHWKTVDMDLFIEKNEIKQDLTDKEDEIEDEEW